MKQYVPQPLQDYMVVIKCFTYNHEPYIEETLKGFVSQKTNFPFCALVVDDFSSDKTAEIIRKYEALYPEIIKGIYLQENYKSQKKQKNPLLKPWFDRCKYIAMCEGDDYWIDPLKLQTQIDFLENHSDYSMCFSGAKVISPQKELEDSLYNGLEEREYFSDEIYKSWIVPTASVVYRSVVKKTEDPDFLFGDIVLFLSLAEKGRVWRFDKKMVVYRRLPSGMTFGYKRATDRINKAEAYVRHHKALERHFPKLTRKCCKIVQAPFLLNKCTALFKEKKYLKCASCFFCSLCTYRIAFLLALKNKFLGLA